MKEINYNLKSEYAKSIKEMMLKKTIHIYENIAVITDFKDVNLIFALYIPK